MAKFGKFDPQEHIHGLSEVARQILREWKRQEEENFQECMEFFRKLAEENRPATANR